MVINIRNSSFRLALIYMGLFGLSVLLLLWFIYWSTAAYMVKQTDAAIDTEISGLAERYRIHGLAGLTELIRYRLSRRPAGSTIYLLTDRTHKPLLGNLNRWPVTYARSNGWLEFDLTDATLDKERLHKARARVFSLSGDYQLLVGRDLFDLEETQQLVIRTLLSGLFITLLLAIIGGIMMSRSSMRRIESINRTSRRIIEGDLSQRIPVHHNGDEFDNLAQNLNSMLARIQELMENVRRVSDNIAHDLRTPLTRLRNRLEQLGLHIDDSHTDEAKIHHNLIHETIAEADQLLKTFNALLRIARIETRARQQEFTTVPLHQLVADVIEFYEPLAEENNQQLSLQSQSPVNVTGDRDLLFQTIANLLDNAIKHTPPGGHIDINLQQQHEPELIIADTGPGIPEAAREKVFERFLRLESSRTTTGSGLGLSLVQVVTKIHRITITLQDNHPGLRVILRFPSTDHIS